MTDIPSTPPYIWPGLLNRAQLSEFPDTTPLDSILQLADGVLGLVYDLDEIGTAWLERQFLANENLNGRIILGLYPACRMTETQLVRLADIARDLQGRVEFRLKILSDDITPLWTALLLSSENNSRQSLYIGPSPNLGINESESSRLNFVFHTNLSTNRPFLEWFDWLWSQSSLLDPETIALPALVPARGTAEAAMKWQTYAERFKPALNAAESPLDNAKYDDPKQDDPNVIAADPDAPPSRQLGIPRHDPLGERIAHLYELGEIVAIDKQTRIPPLDAPIKAELFGDASFQEVGDVQRQTTYRISALDKHDLDKLNKARTAPSSLLKNYSFAMNDGVRWMPLRAKSLFESELKRIELAGEKDVAAILQGDISGFLRQKKSKIWQDATRMYQILKPNQALPEEQVEQILQSLQVRLERLAKGQLLPRVTYTPVTFGFTQDSAWASRWGQPLTLLLDIAKFHRKAVSDSYFFRGLRIDQETYVRAMNVCDDRIVSDAQSMNVVQRARQELDFIQEIEKVEIIAKAKCEILFDLMGGTHLDTLRSELQSHQEAAPSPATDN